MGSEVSHCSRQAEKWTNISPWYLVARVEPVLDEEEAVRRQQQQQQQVRNHPSTARDLTELPNHVS